MQTTMLNTPDDGNRLTKYMQKQSTLDSLDATQAEYESMQHPLVESDKASLQRELERQALAVTDWINGTRS